MSKFYLVRQYPGGPQILGGTYDTLPEAMEAGNREYRIGPYRPPLMIARVVATLENQPKWGEI